MNYRIRIVLVAVLCFALIRCTKEDNPTPPIDPPGNGDTTTLSFKYQDSVFYLKPGQEDYTVSPVTSRAGEYIGFPEGIEINEKTGVINVSKSETGLKYLVSFIPQGSSDTLKTYITISGINYLDGFYVLDDGDSIANPVYNGNPALSIPGINDGSVFDKDAGCNDNGCNVIPENAKINLAQTVRNGVFGDKPANNDRHEFELVYQINDKSDKATNKLKIKLYYFKTMDDVTPEAYDIITSRDGTILSSRTAAFKITESQKTAKPRPPCIFIVGRSK